MNYSMLEEAMEPVQTDWQVDAMSVYRAFEALKDGRKKRGVRYSAALMLTLILLGKLAGMSSLAASARGSLPFCHFSSKIMLK
jgi:hypothetical protein